MKDNCCENCGEHGHEHKHNIEDIAYSAHYKIDALISLLINKGLFIEEDYEKEMDGLYNEVSDEASENKE